MNQEPKITIKRSVSGFRVVVTGRNGEPLSVSEVLSTKPDAMTNIYAQAEAWSLWNEREIRTQFRDERSPLRHFNAFVKATRPRFFKNAEDAAKAIKRAHRKQTRPSKRAKRGKR